jgi:DNA-binding XRE family transcriptional regulator
MTKKTLKTTTAKRPVNRANVNAYKKRMRDEIGSFRLREIRESLSITQVELAERLNVSQNRVSRIEHGDIDRAQVDTLRRYVEAVGGTLRVEVVIGDDQILIA